MLPSSRVLVIPHFVLRLPSPFFRDSKPPTPLLRPFLLRPALFFESRRRHGLQSSPYCGAPSPCGPGGQRLEQALLRTM